MFGFVGTIFMWAAVLAWVGYGVSQKFDFNPRDERPFVPITTSRLMLAHVLPVLLLLIVSGSVYQVEAGHAVVVKRFGVVQAGSSGPGIHVKIPVVDSLVDYRTMQLTYETGDNPADSQAVYPDYTIETMTQDGQKVKMRYTIVFHIDPTKIGYLVNNIGDEGAVVERVVKSISRSEARNIPKSFKAADLYGPNIYKAELAIKDKLTPMFSDVGVILDQFLLREVTFDPELTKALEDKQIALEKQTTSERMVQVAKNEAAAKVETAKGDAEAARLMQAQLEKSPTYNQFILVTAIKDGKLPNLTYLGVAPDLMISGK